jgi:YgiT-type zinc finger domain-containing protein
MEDSYGKRYSMKPYDDCIYCGGEVVEKLENTDYRYHGQLYILENVPTGVCVQCGEKYYTAKVAKLMEEAVSRGSKDVQMIAVPVLSINSVK